MTTIKQMKEELWILAHKNRDVEFWLDIEKKRKHRYEYLLSVGMEKEAKEVAESILALKLDEQLVGVADLEAKYIRLISMLEQQDKQLATMRFLKGMTIKEIARRLDYSYGHVRRLFCGRQRETGREDGIYDKLFQKLNK